MTHSRQNHSGCCDGLNPHQHELLTKDGCCDNEAKTPALKEAAKPGGCCSGRTKNTEKEEAGMKPPVCIGIHAVIDGDGYQALQAHEDVKTCPFCYGS